MSEALEMYRRLENHLVRIRWLRGGAESVEEDALLDQMDVAWSRLSPQEQAQLNAEPVRSLVSDGLALTRTILDEDVWSHRSLPPRRQEAA